MMTKAQIIREFFASLVVFFIALPLCMGIALASGAPPAAGLLTGIIGGIVAGAFAGCRVQVSGPAAGLTVVVLELIQTHGLGTLGVVVAAAGVLQVIAGRLKLGRLFQAVPPAVVHGMLAGIGIIILVSQLHIMVDGKTHGSPIQNILAMPAALSQALSATATQQAAGLGLLTIAVMIVWKLLKLNKLTRTPEALPAIVLATTVAAICGWGVHHVVVPEAVGDLISPVSLGSFAMLTDLSIIKAVLTLAFVASAESMLSAAAVDQMHTCDRTNYSKELDAQGRANIVSGLLGGLPLTGVIVRSRVNIEAGGRTRLASVLHGVWLLAAVALLPGLLAMIPTSALAALLVVTGWKLIDWKVLKSLRQFGWGEVVIFLVTVGLVVGVDLLTGVLAGLALALARAGWQLVTKLEIKLTPGPNGSYDLVLRGIATFAMKWKIGAVLDQIPNKAEVRLHSNELLHIDHGFLEMILLWQQQHVDQGGTVAFERERLIEKAMGPRKIMPMHQPAEAAFVE